VDVDLVVFGGGNLFESLPHRGSSRIPQPHRELELWRLIRCPFLKSKELAPS